MSDIQLDEGRLPLTTHQVAKILLEKPDITLHIDLGSREKSTTLLTPVYSVLASGKIGEDITQVVIEGE